MEALASLHFAERYQETKHILSLFLHIPHTSYAKHNPEISHHQATKKKLPSLNIRNKYVFAITAMVHSGTRKAEEISCFIHSHKSTTIDENRKSLIEPPTPCQKNNNLVYLNNSLNTNKHFPAVEEPPLGPVVL